MEALKFFNISQDPMDEIFFRFASQLLQKNGIENIYEKIELEEGWPSLEKKLVGGRAALLDLNSSVRVTSQLPALPADMRFLNCADTLIFENGQWWPHLNLKESLRHLIVSRAKTLDIKESAYVIGEGATLRVMASLVVGFGFSKVYLVGESIDILQTEISQLKKSYVGVAWYPLDANQLTMQTVGATLLINATSLKDKPELQNDLAYFNFMKNQGLVVNLDVLPLKNPLLEEAARANLRCLSGFEVRANKDYSLLKRLGLSSIIAFDDYLVAWGDFLAGLPE